MECSSHPSLCIWLAKINQFDIIGASHFFANDLHGLVWYWVKIFYALVDAIVLETTAAMELTKLYIWTKALVIYDLP